MVGRKRMKVSHADDLSYDENPLPHRAGKIAFKYLLEGEPLTADNYSAVLSRESASFFSPRHRHPWDQVRYCIDGSVPIAPRVSIDAGEVGYFPEGVRYGPQEGDTDRLVLVVQFGGASGQGYLGYDQVRAGQRELLSEGAFERGVFKRKPGSKGRKNQDGYEAVWQHVIGRPVNYSPPRFKGPVVMQPQNYGWVGCEGLQGVRRKPLGSFSERNVGIEFQAIDEGISLELVPSKDRRLIFFTSGEGIPYKRHTAVSLEPGEALLLTAETPTEFLLITLPLVRKGL